MSYPSNTQGQPWRRFARLSILSLVVVLFLGLYSSVLAMPDVSTGSRKSSGMVEPDAGSWKTWLLASGDQLRLPAPPNKNATKEEVKALKALAAQRDDADLERIAYWNAGGPVYRWNRVAVDTAVDKNLNPLITNRHMALLNTALEDAMIAAWDSKYAYMRPRPSLFDKKVVPVVDVPNSPSYPSEQAVAAGAAARILSHIYPDLADQFTAMEAEAAQAVLLAGTHYPSDVEAGLELGRQVADLFIAHAATDGTADPWTGTVPTDPTGWTGTNPALPQAANWRTYVLASGDEVRPGPPPAYGSDQLNAEMDALRALERTPRMVAHGFFWEYAAGGTRNNWFWNNHLEHMALEYNLGDNPPRAARAYALVNTAMHDATVACWDAKYTYWAIRPFQYDPEFKPLFTTPNHPSYPSAHSCLSGAASGVLSYLFPNHAGEFDTYTVQAGEARIWAGLHFASDIAAGDGIGSAVAAKVVAYGESDGSK